MRLFCRLPTQHYRELGQNGDYRVAPDGIDAAWVARRALADDVLFAPGNLFSVSQSAGNFMRFNVSRMDDPKIFRVLLRAIAECAH